MLLKKKRPLLNSHILHLTFSLVGTVDSGHETSIIPNSTAFQDLLCDFEVRSSHQRSLSDAVTLLKISAAQIVSGIRKRFCVVVEILNIYI